MPAALTGSIKLRRNKDKAMIRRTPVRKKRSKPRRLANARLIAAAPELLEALNMIRRTPVRKKRSKPRRGRVRDPKYLEWIRTQKCWVDSCMNRAEAAHVGSRGLSQKCSDREVIPLCVWHHRTGGKSQHTLGKKFWEFWGIERSEVIEHYNKLYEAENGIRD